jgi:hypothetical protein
MVPEERAARFALKVVIFGVFAQLVLLPFVVLDR